MKLHSKLSTGLIIALATLLTIGLAYAQPVPIGKTTWLEDPFDSTPTAISTSGTYPMDAGKEYDGRFLTFDYFYLAEDWMDGWIEWSGFGSSPSAFTIGWVDIKMMYLVDINALDDTHRIEYSIDGSTWITLQSDIVGPFDRDDTPGDAQICSWAEVSRPGGGAWTWTDIGNLRVRVYHTPGADFSCDYATMAVYEIWAVVYKPPLPPSASTGMSIQPPVVETLSAGRRFFFEVYVQNVTALAGWMLTVNFNTTVLNTIAGGFWSYYPFYVDVSELNDPGGYVSIAASIPVTDPLYSTGVTGNLSIARIYLSVATGMTASDYSWLTFNVSLMGDPAAKRIEHGVYHGLYGTPPANTHLMGWIPASEFNWTDPVCTWWHEQYPDFCNEWHLTSWTEENGDELFGPSDQIDMIPEPPDGYKYWFHVDEIWECFVDAPAPGQHNPYMLVTFKTSEPTPEFPLGVGLMMLLALAIPIVYLWRTRKKDR